MAEFFNFTELKKLHIELTNACNAACPMCVRFYRGSPLTRPDLNIEQITVDKFKKYFPPEVIKQCSHILFCGVHGDPGMAKDLYEICEYIGQVGDSTSLDIDTNGGMRDVEFWERFGKLFAANHNEQRRWNITFSIDGLEDTNHIYRRNVNWDKLMSNAQAFIQGGGRASWQFLIFKHNEHQILEAKGLSEQLGFKKFYPKKALGVDNGTYLQKMPVLNREGKLDYFIEPPVDPKNRNLENPASEEVIQRVDEFEIVHYKRVKELQSQTSIYKIHTDKVYDKLKLEDTTKLDQSIIKCKAESDQGKEVFIDNHGRVLPCCWVGTHLNGQYYDSASLQLHHEMSKYGWEHFSLETHSLKEILEAHHLDRVYTDSWEKVSCGEGKMAYCSSICGTYSRIDKIYTHELFDK